MKSPNFVKVFLCIFCFVLCACQQEDVHANEKEPDKQEKCDDKEVIVEINEIQFRILRYGTSLRLEDGTLLNGISELPYLCDLKHIKNVQSVRTTGWTIAKNLNRSVESRKDFIQKIYDKATKEKLEIIKLPSGIIRIGHSKYQRYILPENSTPEVLDKPLIFGCFGNPEHRHSTASCGASYIHKSGVLLSFSFFGNKYMENDLMQAYQDFNKKINGRIIVSDYIKKEND